ncbi:hypothetical protein Trydic_g21057 [Trypoxylus dichotomus]
MPNTARQRNGVRRPVRSCETVERARAPILESIRHSARKHTMAFGLSDCVVKRIAHSDLYYQPYKLAILHELFGRDFNWWRKECEAILENVPTDAILFFSDQPISIGVDRSRNRACATGLTLMPKGLTYT